MTAVLASASASRAVRARTVAWTMSVRAGSPVRGSIRWWATPVAVDPAVDAGPGRRQAEARPPSAVGADEVERDAGPRPSSADRRPRAASVRRGRAGSRCRRRRRRRRPGTGRADRAPDPRASPWPRRRGRTGGRPVGGRAPRGGHDPATTSGRSTQARSVRSPASGHRASAASRASSSATSTIPSVRPSASGPVEHGCQGRADRDPRRRDALSRARSDDVENRVRRSAQAASRRSVERAARRASAAAIVGHRPAGGGCPTVPPIRPVTTETIDGSSSIAVRVRTAGSGHGAVADRRRGRR